MESIERKKPLFSQEKIKRAQELIMPYSEYIKLDPKPHFPDHYYIEGKNKKILFYQVRHSHDPEDILFQEIPKLMQEFKPSKVFVERQGWLNHIETMPEEEFLQRKEIIEKRTDGDVIKNGGEPGFAIKKALEMGLKFNDIISPEKQLQDTVHLVKNYSYSPTDVFFYEVLLALGSTAYSGNNIMTEEELGRICDKFSKVFKIENSDIVSFFKQNYEKFLLEKFDLHKPCNHYRKYTTPLPNKDGSFGYFNKLANISSRFRDETIIEKIVEVLEKNDKLMIVYGGSHGTVQKPALEYLLHE